MPSRKATIEPAPSWPTDRALAALSLIHTLICVQIFQTFDCDKFDAGDEKGSTIGDGEYSFPSSDYSISCNTENHKAYEAMPSS